MQIVQVPLLEFIGTSLVSNKKVVIQWGKVYYNATRENITTVSFPTAYTTINYCINGNSFNSASLGSFCTYTHTTTSFIGRLYGHGSGDKPLAWEWHAVGY